MTALCLLKEATEQDLINKVNSSPFLQTLVMSIAIVVGFVLAVILASFFWVCIEEYFIERNIFCEAVEFARKKLLLSDNYRYIRKDKKHKGLKKTLRALRYEFDDDNKEYTKIAMNSLQYVFNLYEVNLLNEDETIEKNCFLGCVMSFFIRKTQKNGDVYNLEPFNLSLCGHKFISIERIECGEYTLTLKKMKTDETVVVKWEEWSEWSSKTCAVSEFFFNERNASNLKHCP